ncbi:DUF1570 domain-containing protein [Isosphaeraceae bacterium EP7]
MRRRWFLRGIVAAAASEFGASRLLARAFDDPEPAKGDGAQAVIELCRKVGLDRSEIERGTGKLFVAAGDAPPAFRREALKICELMARSYLEHFKAKGFEVKAPDTPMVIVTLASVKSFEAFTGEKSTGGGGHFDLETNRLVMFNFKANDAPQVGSAEMVNRLTLIHEAMHQLCYNTGLLDLNADVPIAISEGFATYAEPWNSSTKKGFGARNPGRALGLSQGVQEAGGWTPIRTVIADDEVFQPGKARSLAYSQSWLLTRVLMQEAPKRAKFRAYLTALKQQQDTTGRVELFETHLGSLDSLDRELRKAAGMRS